MPDIVKFWFTNFWNGQHIVEEYISVGVYPSIFILILVNWYPVLVVLHLLTINRSNVEALRNWALAGCFGCLGMCMYLTWGIDFITGGFFHLEAMTFCLDWMDISPTPYITYAAKGGLYTFTFGLDGMSFSLYMLTTVLLFVCVLSSWDNITFKVKEFYILLYLITFLLYNVFTVLDVFLFYIFFEAILIPMFLIVGIWGSRSRRIHAAYQFFLYTLVGSLFMLLGIITLYLHVGSTSWFAGVLNDLPFYKELFIWLTFFISFAVKVPVIPFHIWLPEAHVEAPTVGSVLLAGILLKMGTYGLLRFSLPFFPNATIFFTPLVFTISLISIIYSSLTTIRQIDLKKVIAYSSVAHMNFVTLGIFSLDLQGLEGSLYLMIGHGIVSSALFLCIGVLYDRYHTRLLPYYGGIVFGMPLFSVCFFIFTLGNVSLPGTVNFVGEFLILTSVTSRSLFTAMGALIGVVLGAVYAMWLFNRVVFGLLKSEFIFKFSDLNRREFTVLFLFIIGTFAYGFMPNSLLKLFHFPCLNILLFL